MSIYVNCESIIDLTHPSGISSADAKMEQNGTKTPLPETGDGSLVFAVNGEKFEVETIDPSTTLLEFLRSHTRFKSVKLGCGEGNLLSYDLFFCSWIF